MHEDTTDDEAQMEELMEDHPILAKNPPMLLKATCDGVELADEDKWLLPERLYGFVLRSRTWAALSIRIVEDAPIQPDGFDDLVLSTQHKTLHSDLVKTHSRGSRLAAGPTGQKDHQLDLIEGTGKGLMIRTV